MPRGDGTGPMGTGPMTGRAAGYCAGYGTPGFANGGGGRGFWGRGGGRGFRHWFHATGLPGPMRAGVCGGPYRQADPKQHKQVLENQAQALQAELEAIKQQITELDTGAET